MTGLSDHVAKDRSDAFSEFITLNSSRGLLMSFRRDENLLPTAMTQLDMAGDMFLMEKELGDSVGSTSVKAHVFPEKSHDSMMGSALQAP